MGQSRLRIILGLACRCTLLKFLHCFAVWSTASVHLQNEFLKPLFHGEPFQNEENGKGCDFGYALADSSCEEANRLEACTVTTLDAIGAFAIPKLEAGWSLKRLIQQ